MSLALVNDPSQKDSTGAAGDPGSTPAPNRDDAEAFLAALDPAATFFTFQTFDDNAERKDKQLTRILHGTLGARWDLLADLNRRGAGIFVTVNATDGRGRSASNVTRVRALFIDLDGTPLPDAFHVKPHIVIESSPGKWHCYWLVTNCDRTQFEALQRRLIRHYGSDPKVTDLPRDMRLPGFVHQKVDKHGRASVPSVTRVVEAHDHDADTVETFIEGLPEGDNGAAEGKRAAKPNGEGEYERQYEDQPDTAQPESGSIPWTPAEEARLRSALDSIPIDEDVLTRELGSSHDVFLNIGRGLERLGWDERGYAIWRDWCRGSADKFDEKGLRTNWASFGRTRDRATKRKVTFRTILYYARRFGWRDPDEKRAEAEPTYAEGATTSAASARAELEQQIEAFLDAEPNCWEKYVGITRCVHAVRAATGIGKTRIAARVIARRIKSGRLTGPVGYSVPTHRLGEDIAEQFRREGVTADVWRGRKAHVSGKDGPTMCDDLAAVKIAEDMGAVIETACCRGPDPAGEIVTCPHYHTCAYQAQKARTPDVWIFAHQMLFRKNKTLDGISALFIDESFRDAGTTKPVKGLTIDEIEAAPPNAGELAVYREILAAEAAARGRCAALQHPLQPEHRGVHQSDPARVEGEGEARAVAGDAGEGSSGCSRGRHQHQTHPHVRPGVARRARIGSARGRRRLRAGCLSPTTRPRTGPCASCGRGASARSQGSTTCGRSSWMRRCRQSRSSRDGFQKSRSSVRSRSLCLTFACVRYSEARSRRRSSPARGATSARCDDTYCRGTSRPGAGPSWSSRRRTSRRRCGRPACRRRSRSSTSTRSRGSTSTKRCGSWSPWGERSPSRPQSKLTPVP